MKNKNLMIAGFVVFLVILISFAFASNNYASSANANVNALSEITLKVLIPCPGHASLIIDELNKAGASTVSFEFPNLFIVKYDSSKIDKSQLLGLDVFKTYSATVVN